MALGLASPGIKVREVGVPAFLSSLSFNHGSLYGVLAVLIAIGAGLGVALGPALSRRRMARGDREEEAIDDGSDQN